DITYGLPIDFKDDVPSSDPCFIGRASWIYSRHNDPLRFFQSQTFCDLRRQPLHRHAQFALFGSRGHHLFILQLADAHRQLQFLLVAQDLHAHLAITGVRATMMGRSPESLISLPSNSMMTSPTLTPAFSAGPSFETLATRAPRPLSIPRLSAISGVTFWISTPK